MFICGASKNVYNPYLGGLPDLPNSPASGGIGEYVEPWAYPLTQHY